MFNCFVKSPLTASAANYLCSKSRSVTISISRENKKQLKQILNTIQKRAEIGYRALSTKEFSEDIKEQLEKLGYVILKIADGYFITW